MPGVPSGRGCDACRKQKKKCDLGQPVCGRCTRLRIPCIGSGQRRYKFQVQTLSNASSGAASSAGSATSTSLVTRQNASSQLGLVVLAPPSSAATMTSGRLLTMLEVLDPRFDLTVYGGFFRELPRRLGTNEALDAAVEALTATLPLLQSRTRPIEPLAKYTQAINALRKCLSDPVKAGSSETLCALYLTVVCEGWIGSEDDYTPSHGVAISYMLKAFRREDRDSAFDNDLLVTMCVLVIFESFVNPTVDLDPDLWNLPETLGPTSPADEKLAIDSLKNRNLAYITKLIRDPEHNHAEIEATYWRVRADCIKMEAILAGIPVVMGEDGRLTTPLPTGARRMHVRLQTGYGILMFVGIVLNMILRAFQETEQNQFLAAEAAMWVDNIILLAEQASQYRPLGSSATPVYLVAAYAAMEDEEHEKRVRLEAVLAEYQSDFKRGRWKELALTMRTRLRTLRLRDLSRDQPLEDEFGAENQAVKLALCCIL